MSKSSPLELFSEKQMQEAIEWEWLGLGDVSKIHTINPFEHQTKFQIENPHLYILELMRNPEYFYFTCKYLLNKSLSPMQLAALRELWIRPFPMLIGSRGFGKSFILALYAVLRATLHQGCKIVIVGSAFRQAKIVFEYCEEIWTNSPILRDICSDSKRNGPRYAMDRCTMRIGDSMIVALPLGDGTKIRGHRANYVIADEFASISPAIYETVISGFGAVSASPIEKMKAAARRRAMKRLGVWTKEDEERTKKSLTNQSIVSGTAYYGFNHFFDYWKRWKGIIESRGDRSKLANLFNGEVPEKFDWRDYSIIKIPYEMIPEGFMDEKTVLKSKATVISSIYLMEYGTIFATDSDGFFKRTLIESCVVGRPNHPIEFPNFGEVKFSSMLRGDPNRRYVMGIDPASERDRFSITILEIWPGHRRIVYCWTTNDKTHKEKLKKGLVIENDFYGFVARKIRDLLRLFPCSRIAMDSQGGGIGVREALRNEKNMLPGEAMILPIIEENFPQPTDDEPGEHILEMIEFAKASWVSEANHGLRKDFEDKTLLFPMFDHVKLGLAIEEDKLQERVQAQDGGAISIYDTLEDCMIEIEEMKDELATIVHTQTGVAGRDHWDTPETKLPGGKKGRLRKDRYSSLLMANAVARNLVIDEHQAEYPWTGGFTQEILARKGQPKHSRHRNPDWYEKSASAANYGSISRHHS